MITGVDFDLDETESAMEGTILLNGERPSLPGVLDEIRTEFANEKFNMGPFRTGEYILTNLSMG